MATFSELMTDLADEVRRITAGNSVNGEKMSIAEMTSTLKNMNFIEGIVSGDAGDLVVELNGDYTYYDNEIGHMVGFLSSLVSGDNINGILNIPDGHVMNIVCKNLPIELEANVNIRDGTQYTCDERLGNIQSIEAVGKYDIYTSGGIIYAYVDLQTSSNNKCYYISGNQAFWLSGYSAKDFITLNDHVITFNDVNNATYHDQFYRVRIKGTST